MHALSEAASELKNQYAQAHSFSSTTACARFYADAVVPAMQKARSIADEIEPILGDEYKPFPSYSDLLFRI